uniref:Secreted protein n=1 Tax=Trichuris muris TaxID=70415 RepID=A0A5S6QLW6_TRIMR
MVAVEALRCANCIHLDASRITAVTMMVDLLDHFSCRHKRMYSRFAFFPRALIALPKVHCSSSVQSVERGHVTIFLKR